MNVRAKRRRSDRSTDQSDMMWEGHDILFLALEKEEWGHKPRNLGDIQKLGESRKWILPYSLQKEHSFTDISMLVQCDPF